MKQKLVVHLYLHSKLKMDVLGYLKSNKTAITSKLNGTSFDSYGLGFLSTNQILFDALDI